MALRLNKKQKMALLDNLSVAKLRSVKKCCGECAMKGDGIGDILKSVMKVLGPVSRTVGPLVLKKWLIPFLEKQAKGSGLALSGGSKCGGALKLSGQGGKRKKKK